MVRGFSLHFCHPYPPNESSSPTPPPLQEYYLPGAHAARMLHRVRRAERMLMSYERTGKGGRRKELG